MYIKRHVEKAVNKIGKMFGAVLVTGARQVGKTTLLRNCLEDISYITLDDPILLEQAQNAPRSFLNDNLPPVFIDEIQKAPNLFPLIKMNIDKEKAKGMYYLSGSQQFQMMKGVSESMSGRVGIVNLHSLSLRERMGQVFDKPFIPTQIYIAERKSSAQKLTNDELWKIIQRGSMPDLVANPDFDWQMFYSAYVKTYIERDVRQLTQVADETKFVKFMSAVACYTGQLLNISSLARDVNISQQTVEKWLSILITSNIVFLLRPFSNNVMARTIKTPKLYFLDTGLAAYLTRWTTPDVLRNGAMAGAFFETFVIGEIIRSYSNSGLEPPIWFYRDKYNEIDLVIECNGTLYPVEIKKHSDPKRSDMRAFEKLDNAVGYMRGEGCVLCMFDKVVTMDERNKAVPLWYI